MCTTSRSTPIVHKQTCTRVAQTCQIGVPGAHICCSTSSPVSQSIFFKPRVSIYYYFSKVFKIEENLRQPEVGS